MRSILLASRFGASTFRTSRRRLGASAAPPTATSLLDWARGLELAGNLDRAEEVLARARRDESLPHANDLCVHGNLAGLVALQRGRLDQARDELTRALELLTKHPTADDFSDVVGLLNDLAATHIAAGRPDEAAACCRRALYMARRAYRPSRKVQRASLLHLAAAEAGEAGASARLDEALELLDGGVGTGGTEEDSVSRGCDFATLHGAVAGARLAEGRLSEASFHCELALSTVAAPSLRPCALHALRVQRAAVELAAAAKGEEGEERRAAAGRTCEEALGHLCHHDLAAARANLKLAGAGAGAAGPGAARSPLHLILGSGLPPWRGGHAADGP